MPAARDSLSGKLQIDALPAAAGCFWQLHCVVSEAPEVLLIAIRCSPCVASYAALETYPPRFSPACRDRDTAVKNSSAVQVLARYGFMPHTTFDSAVAMLKAPRAYELVLRRRLDTLPRNSDDSVLAYRFTIVWPLGAHGTPEQAELALDIALATFGFDDYPCIAIARNNNGGAGEELFALEAFVSVAAPADHQMTRPLVEQQYCEAASRQLRRATNEPLHLHLL